MIPAPPGTRARYRFDHNGQTTWESKAVVAFDDDGLALVVPDTGARLANASRYRNFAGLVNYADDPDDLVALLPADGWRVRYRNDTADADGAPSGHDVPLLAWGLRRDGEVVPLDVDAAGSVAAAVDVSNFVQVYRQDQDQAS